MLTWDSLCPTHPHPTPHMLAIVSTLIGALSIKRVVDGRVGHREEEGHPCDTHTTPASTAPPPPPPLALHQLHHVLIGQEVVLANLLGLVLHRSAPHPGAARQHKQQNKGRVTPVHGPRVRGGGAVKESAGQAGAGSGRGCPTASCGGSTYYFRFLKRPLWIRSQKSAIEGLVACSTTGAL